MDHSNLSQSTITPEKASIIVQSVSKSFRIYSDKSHTLKEKVLSRKRSQYKCNQVLDCVDFTVRQGEAVGLIGHNGSGKSTTLKLINRILYPDSGSITINGKVSSLIELGAGFHPDMTGRENIYINASIFGLKKAEIDNRLEDIIRFSELEEFIDNPVRTYSSGMYMRLAFSIAINVNADILLIDEILAVGDSNFQKKCFDRLMEIKQEGVTIVLVSHSMDQIRSICDRVIWLEKGKIYEDGKTRVVCNHYIEEMEKKAAARHSLELSLSGNASLDPSVQYPPVSVNPFCNPVSNRTGNLQIRFEKIELKDISERSQHSFQIGDSILLSMDLISEQEKPEVNVIIKLFNRFGGHCFSLESQWIENKFLCFDSHLHINLTIGKLYLIPGEYYLECAIRDSHHILTDNLLHFLDFSIVPKYDDERDNLGVLYVTPKWDIK